MAKSIAKPAAVPTPTQPNVVYFPLVRDENGWFVAGRNPRGYASEAAAQKVAAQTTADPEAARVVAVDVA